MVWSSKKALRRRVAHLSDALAAAEERIAHERWIIRVMDDRLQRAHAELLDAQQEHRALKEYLNGESVARDYDGAQTWGLVYAISPQELGLRSSDHFSFEFDHLVHAYKIDFRVRGHQSDLVAVVDRLIWTLERMRHKAAQKPAEQL